MANLTLINFQKNNGLADVKKSNGESSLNDRANIFSQLIEFVHDKELKFDISRIPDGVNNSCGFIMKNDSGRIIVNFEEKKDNYYTQLEQIYIKRKIEKDNKVKKFKNFISAAVLTATIAGATFIGVEGYFKELDMMNESIKENYEQLIERNPDNESIKFVANKYDEYTSNSTKSPTR